MILRCIHWMFTVGKTNLCVRSRIPTNPGKQWIEWGEKILWKLGEFLILNLGGGELPEWIWFEYFFWRYIRTVHVFMLHVFHPVTWKVVLWLGSSSLIIVSSVPLVWWSRSPGVLLSSSGTTTFTRPLTWLLPERPSLSALSHWSQAYSYSPLLTAGNTLAIIILNRSLWWCWKWAEKGQLEAEGPQWTVMSCQQVMVMSCIPGGVGRWSMLHANTFSSKFDQCTYIWLL